MLVGKKIGLKKQFLVQKIQVQNDFGEINYGSKTIMGPKTVLFFRKFVSKKYFSYKIVGSKLFFYYA